jgi:hypothetical protein
MLNLQKSHELRIGFLHKPKGKTSCVENLFFAQTQEEFIK